jgi:hypothetical protein
VLDMYFFFLTLLHLHCVITLLSLMLLILRAICFFSSVYRHAPIRDELIFGLVFGFFPYDTILFPCWIGLTFFCWIFVSMLMGFEHMMITGFHLHKLA